ILFPIVLLSKKERIKEEGAKSEQGSWMCEAWDACPTSSTRIPKRKSTKPLLRNGVRKITRSTAGLACEARFSPWLVRIRFPEPAIHMVQETSVGFAVDIPEPAPKYRLTNAL